MKRLTLNEYLREQFSCKVYKLSIEGGFSCPNRDGTVGTGGCIFCSGVGSGDFAVKAAGMTVTKQIEEAKSKVSKKIGEDGKYIAYFQSFTNTYGPIDVLRAKFTEAINHPDVVAVSIATRPDCLPDEVLDLLEELNHIKPVWVELGLQTIHASSAEYIRRGYDLPVYDQAMDSLKKRGIYTIVHVIIGLPQETKAMILETVDYVAKSGADGIKLQLLHVLRGTDLAKDYEAGLFEALSLEEYVDIIVQCDKLLPENIIIHRMTGDGAKKDLIAPLWSANKKMVLNSLNKALQ